MSDTLTDAVKIQEIKAIAFFQSWSVLSNPSKSDDANDHTEQLRNHQQHRSEAKHCLRVTWWKVRNVIGRDSDVMVVAAENKRAYHC